MIAWPCSPQGGARLGESHWRLSANKKLCASLQWVSKIEKSKSDVHDPHKSTPGPTLAFLKLGRARLDHQQDAQTHMIYASEAGLCAAAARKGFDSIIGFALAAR